MRMQSTKRLIGMLALFFAGVALLPHGTAQEKAADTKPKSKADQLGAKAAEQESKTQEALRNELASFGSLVEFGKKYKLAEALADAGGILLKLSNTGLDSIEAEPVVDLPRDAAKKVVKPVTLAAQAEDLFDEARACAKDRQGVEAYIRTIKTAAQEGFATRGVKKLEKKILKDERKITALDKKILKDLNKGKGKHRDVAANNPMQHLGALQQNEKHTLSFAPDGKPINLCFQSSAPLLVEVVESKGNAVVWSSQGLSGQYRYAVGANFSVRIGAPASDITYMLLIN
jgi:hypothetical protein